MWKFLLAGCMATEDCDKELIDPVRVVLVIDGSGSVEPEAFKNQIRLANSVLNGVRNLYSEYPEQTVPWQWAAVQFAVDVEVIKDTHEDGGPSDALDESLSRLCPTPRIPLLHDNKCGTHYEPALVRAHDLLAQIRSGRAFVWFLTDGQAQDISTPEKMRAFRASDKFAPQNITSAAVYLTPDASTIEQSSAILQELTCPITNPTCTDRVHAWNTSADIASLAQKTQDMFYDIVKRVVPVKCAVSAATAPPALAIAAIAVVAVLAALTVTALAVGKKKWRPPVEEAGMHDPSHVEKLPTARLVRSRSSLGHPTTSSRARTGRARRA